jgi:hypothetical protein
LFLAVLACLMRKLAKQAAQPILAHTGFAIDCHVIRPDSTSEVASKAAHQPLCQLQGD